MVRRKHVECGVALTIWALLLAAAAVGGPLDPGTPSWPGPDLPTLPPALEGHQGDACELGRLLPDDGLPYAGISLPVVFQGTTAAVTSRQDGDRVVIVYRDDPGGWTVEQRLIDPDPASFGSFGSSLALDGDTLVVSAPFDDPAGVRRAGLARVFVRSGGTWSLEQTLTAATPLEGSSFGTALAIEGDLLVVGAPGNRWTDGETIGLVHVFTRSGAVWTDVDVFEAPVPVVRDQFGETLAVDSGTLLVGAPFTRAGTQPGAVHVYVGAPAFVHQAELTPAPADLALAFGWALAVEGDRAMVGAIGDRDAIDESGAVFVFSRAAGLWTQDTRLIAPDSRPGDAYGMSVALEAGRLLVGAGGRDGVNASEGRVYQYFDGPGGWRLEAELLADGVEAWSYFGWSLAIDGDRALISAPWNWIADGESGTAHFFDLACAEDFDGDGLFTPDDNCPDDPNPAQADADGDGRGDDCDSCPTAPDPEAEDRDADGIGDACDSCTDSDGDGFADPGIGVSTCIDDNCPLVPNPGQMDSDADGRGDACLACEQQVLQRQPERYAGNFGAAVAVDGDRILVGDNEDLDVLGLIGRSEIGAAILYERSGGSFEEVVKFFPSQGDSRGELGRSVALSGDLVVTDANRRVYVWEKLGADWVETGRLDTTPGALSSGAVTVATDGVQILVGIGSDDEAAENAGAVLVFERVAGVWTQVQKLLSDPVAGLAFGASLALSGDTLVVGADARWRSNGIIPRCVFFERVAGTWSASAEVLGPPGSGFGSAVALDGDRAVLVQPQHVDSGGLAQLGLIHDRDGGAWTESARLRLDLDPTSPLRYPAVALRGDALLFGAAYGRDGEIARRFVFNGGSWRRDQDFVPADALSTDEAGSSVALGADFAVIGAPEYERDGDRNIGRVHVYWTGCLDDDDLDGVSRGVDNCPELANPGQEDTDSDGLGDDCDNCPGSPNPGQFDLDADGIGDDCDTCTDPDGDGWGVGLPADDCSLDLCPGQFDPEQLDSDSDGVGDACDGCPLDADAGQLDGDADGIGDACDLCPSFPDFAQGDLDGDGLGEACDPDRDGDGVPNGEDNCGITPNADQLDANGNDIGDACEGCTEAEFGVPPTGIWEYLGATLRREGDLLISGAPAKWSDGTGSAYAFARAGGGWDIEARLAPIELSPGAEYGASLALSGGRVLVGAPEHEAPGAQHAGAAYIHVRDGGAWTVEVRLESPLPKRWGRFGSALDLDGDVAVVATSLDPPLVPATRPVVLVYERLASVWTLVETVDPQFPGVFDGISALSLDGPWLAVGSAPTSRVVLYERVAGSFVERRRLGPGSAQASSRFGAALRLRGDRLVVGAPRDEALGGLAGSAQLYRLNGRTWLRETSLLAASSPASLEFGTAVDLVGGRVAVGGRNHALIFDEASAWEPSKQLSLIEGFASPGGGGVALDGEKLLLGAPEHRHDDGTRGRIAISNARDSDADGLADCLDGCPDDANPLQEDSDLDGIQDACDACPADPDNDLDGDGLCRESDNCPDDANSDQADRDGDGLGDVCDPFPDDPVNDEDLDGIGGDVDNCPTDPNPGQEDSDGDGAGDACDPCPLDATDDADADGVCENLDNCPGLANDQTDTDGDGVGDPCDPCPVDFFDDRDGDGVCDRADNCPDDFNSSQADLDGDGLGNACDPCLFDADNDRDFDTICGDTDNCPDVANEDQADLDGDDVGDACDPCPTVPLGPDRDGDLAGDDCDNCPDLPNPDQADEDEDGFGDACDPIDCREPSALDSRNVEPLRVSRLPAGFLEVAWEVRSDATDGVYVGDLDELWRTNEYDYGATEHCGVRGSRVTTLDIGSGSAYYVVRGGCTGGESSAGRSSFGNERDSDGTTCR